MTPVDNLTPNQRAALLGEAKRALARDSLLSYAQRMERGYESPPHVRKIIELLEMLERRQISKAMIFIQPRSGKTLLCARLFSSWYMGRHPTDQLILASHSAELAQEHGRATRDYIRDEEYPFDTKVSSQSSAVNRFHTTDGGVVVSAGLDTGLTGRGAHVLIIDDIIKDAETASSETHSEKVLAWYQTVARTRLMTDAIELHISTRWSDMDLCGQLLAGPEGHKFHVLSLPAFAGPSDPLNRNEGDVLWPERYDRSFIEAQREAMGSKKFAALYQQDPVANSAGIFQEGWFGQRYDCLPTLRAPGSHLKTEFSVFGSLKPCTSERDWIVMQAVDGAWKQGPSSSYSAIATWMSDGVDFFLVDAWHGRVSYVDLKRMVELKFNQFQPCYVYVEAAASGYGILDDLKVLSNIPLVGVTPRGSKESRAEEVTPLFEAGRVSLPRSGPFVEEWVNEHLRFPYGKSNDFVDTTSLCLGRLRDFHLRRRSRALLENAAAWASRSFQK